MAKQSSTKTRKTTARGGGTKSAKARAMSHARRSAGGGAAGASAAKSRTTARTGTDDRRSNPGPGDFRSPGRPRSAQAEGRGNRRTGGPAPKRAK